MADDKVAIWGSGLKFGRKPANGELLIGNGQDMTMATLTAGAGASITNAAGEITISATGSGGTVTGVTASSPLASSGGSSPDISLTGTVGVANGGTGRTSLTANNVLLGNGTGAVGLVAPGASGNVLTSDGTTWASTAPAPPATTWNASFKTSDQSVTSSISYVDVTGLTFPFDANGTYVFRFFYAATNGAGGGLRISVNGSAAASSLIVGYSPTVGANSSYGANIVFFVGGVPSPTTGFISGVVVFGGSSGTFAVRFAQGASDGTATTIKAGSYIEWKKVA